MLCCFFTFFPLAKCASCLLDFCFWIFLTFCLQSWELWDQICPVFLTLTNGSKSFELFRFLKMYSLWLLVWQSCGVLSFQHCLPAIITICRIKMCFYLCLISPGQGDYTGISLWNCKKKAEKKSVPKNKYEFNFSDSSRSFLTFGSGLVCNSLNFLV